MTDISRYTRVKKLVVIFNFFLLFLCAILLSNSVTSGYELSIYSAIPISVWVLVSISIISNVYLIIREVYDKSYDRDNFWAIPFFNLVLNYVLIFALPLIRGYALYGQADTSVHLGQTYQILSTGYIPSDNVYPVLAIYGSILSQLGHVDPQALFLSITLLFEILFFLFFYVFAKTVLAEKGRAILAVTASTAPITGWLIYVTPNALANLFLPLALFVVVQNVRFPAKRIQYLIILFVFIALLVVFHPLVALTFLILLVSLNIFERYSRTARDKSSFERRTLTVAPLVLLFLLVTWVSGFYAWQAAIKNVATLVTEGAPTRLDQLSNQIIYAGGFGYNPVQIILKTYAGLIVYSIISMMAIFVIFRRSKRKNNSKNDHLLYPFLLWGVILCGLIGLFFFANISSFTPLRFLYYVILVLFLLVGYISYEWISSTRVMTGSVARRVFIPALIGALICFTSFSGIITVYPSPYILKPNDQVTRANLEGIGWYIAHKSSNGETVTITLSGGYYEYLYLLTPEALRSFSASIYLNGTPYHFGYSNHTYVSEVLPSNSYVLLDQQDKVFYSELYTKAAPYRFLPGDFTRLGSDPSIAKIYSSSGFECWYVNG